MLKLKRKLAKRKTSISEMKNSFGQPFYSGQVRSFIHHSIIFVQTKKFQRDLSESEVRREEAERTAAEKGLRLIEVSGQMEESRMDSEHLSRQVVAQSNMKHVSIISTSRNTV